MLVEDMQADNANSTLNVVIWGSNKNAIYSFKALSTTARLRYVPVLDLTRSAFTYSFLAREPQPL
jgi:hypothetical protein